MTTPASFSLHDVTPAEAAAVDAAIDRQELIDLVLALCNIPSPMGKELAAGNFVFDWMTREGFAPRKVGIADHRFNVVGRYGGIGDGANLLFTSHLDTESPFYDHRDAHAWKPATVADPQWLSAWLDGETFFGHAVGNDRGPMACFLIAAKALKQAGIELAGTLYLTACPGEIGPEPAEECQGVDYLGKELGAAYMLAHGGVAPDFAIAAEGTDFGVNWSACGYAYYKITLEGTAVFTPLIDHPDDVADHPNPIVRMAAAIEVLQRWSVKFEREHRYEGPGGTSVPKVQVGAIRGGNPQSMGGGSEICSLYVEVCLTPQQEIGPVDRDLKAAFRAAGMGDAVIEPYVVRHGFEARPETVQPLHTALDHGHAMVKGGPIAIGNPVYSSMWRDHNIFNMNRIPAVTMGPVRWRPSIDDLVDCARLYARTALILCGRARKE